MLFTAQTIGIIDQLYLLSLVLVFSGLGAVVFRQKHLILVLMALELALLGLSFFFVLNAIFTNTIFGQLVVFVLLTLGGAESALGLALVMLYFNLKSSIRLTVISDLKY